MVFIAFAIGVVAMFLGSEWIEHRERMAKIAKGIDPDAE